MPRPNKYNLQYFPFDVGFFEDHKILMIEEDLGFEGGYIAIRLLTMIYEQGYYMEWKDKQEFSTARRIGKSATSTLVLKVLHSCIKHGLFNKKLFDEAAVLTSSGIQKRWLLVMTLMRRKIEINRDLWVVSSEETGGSFGRNPEENPGISEENPPPATFSTQKEMKLNEIKGGDENSAAPPRSFSNTSEEKIQDNHAPPPPKAINLDQAKEPYWHVLKKIWMEFCRIKFHAEPSFGGKEGADFKILLKKIQDCKPDGKKINWKEETAVRLLREFLELAYNTADDWLRGQFLLHNLHSQFDAIIRKKSTALHEKPLSDLNYLFERYCEGNLDKRFILPEHFLKLKATRGIDIDEEIINIRKNSLEGSNENHETRLFLDYESNRETKLTENDKPVLMRIAVLEYFKKLKIKNLPAPNVTPNP